MSLKQQILALMADNRERTATDVSVRVSPDIEQVKSDLACLLRNGRVTVDAKSSKAIPIYRIASAKRNVLNKPYKLKLFGI